jgi:hypothetical protein
VSTAAAGWYPQPDGQRRYWDGELWTDRFAQGDQEPNPAPTASGTVEVKGHNGTIVFSTDFVTIKRTGFIARGTLGKGEKRIPVASINAIQWKPAGAMFNGYIQFTIGGGNEVRSQFGHQTKSAVKDENSVVFMKKQMPAFQALREQIEGVIAQRGRPASVAAAVARDPLDQLKQLSELRDAGIVTEEEFAAKKVSILAQM